MKRVLIVFVTFFLVSELFAQQDLTLYELRSAPQSHSLNPSKIPLCKGYLILPGLGGGYGSFSSNGFTYSDIFKYNGKGKPLEVTIGDGIDKMKDLNQIGFDLRIPIIAFGVRAFGGFTSFGVETKISNRFTIPKTLAEFVWLGNGSQEFLGKRASFDGLGANFLQYTEVALGYARDINDEWTAGIKLKYLNGQAYLNTTESKLGITTNADNYAITLDGQFNTESAGVQLFNIDSIVRFKAPDIDEMEDNIGNSDFGNHGGAIDIGATYKINEKLSVNMSVLDIGVISWGKSAKVRNSKSISYTYEGISINDYTGESGSAQDIVNTLDSLYKGIQFTEEKKKITTVLPVKIYAGGNYRLLPKTDVSALSYSEIYNGTFKTAIRIGVTQKVRNFLMATLNYSIYGNSAANVGAGFTVNAGPVQLYVVSDNVIAFITPENTKNFHMRAGINLTFGNNFSQN